MFPIQMDIVSEREGGMARVQTVRSSRCAEERGGGASPHNSAALVGISLAISRFAQASRNGYVGGKVGASSENGATVPGYAIMVANGY